MKIFSSVGMTALFCLIMLGLVMVEVEVVAVDEDIIWDFGLFGSSSPITIQVGDSILFDWTGSGSTTHDVFLMTDSTAFGICSFSGASVLASTCSAGTSKSCSVQFNASGTFDLGCAIGSHCGGGMKLEVIVEGPSRL